MSVKKFTPLPHLPSTAWVWSTHFASSDTWIFPRLHETNVQIFKKPPLVDKFSVRLWAKILVWLSLKISKLYKPGTKSLVPLTAVSFNYICFFYAVLFSSSFSSYLMHYWLSKSFISWVSSKFLSTLISSSLFFIFWTYYRISYCSYPVFEIDASFSWLSISYVFP